MIKKKKKRNENVEFYDLLVLEEIRIRMINYIIGLCGYGCCRIIIELFCEEKIDIIFFIFFFFNVKWDS